MGPVSYGRRNCQTSNQNVHYLLASGMDLALIWHEHKELARTLAWIWHGFEDMKGLIKEVFKRPELRRSGSSQAACNLASEDSLRTRKGDL